jgi:ubiquitin C-terminal hydrolase
MAQGPAQVMLNFQLIINALFIPGHYTAFATNNKAWFNFNDCSVKETDFQTVNSCKAYILFYVQRDF